MNFESKKFQEMMSHSSIGEIFHIEPQGGRWISRGYQAGYGAGPTCAKNAKSKGWLLSEMGLSYS